MAVQKGEKKQERGRSKDESLTNIHLSIFLYLTQNLFTIGLINVIIIRLTELSFHFTLLWGPNEKVS